MRIAALIFGLLGVAGSGFLGGKWMKDKPTPEVLQVMKLIDPKAATEQEARNRSAPVFLGGALLGLVAVVLAGKRVGLVAAVLFFVAFGAPLAVYGNPAIALFTFGLALAGLFSLFIRKRPATFTPLDRGV